jgi:polysaccharide export outer membrane protein
MVRLRSLVALVPVMMLAGLAAPVRAQQQPWDPRRIYATRESLEGLYRRYQASAESPAYSEVLREEARQLAEGVHQRLVNGDFQVGDRIRLAVQNEAALTDTFTVVEGPKVILPSIGPVPLNGVLRSEVPDYLKTQIARYVRAPTVIASSYIRLSIQGEVVRPGFYTLPTDVVISDALQAAQGFTANTKLGDIKLVRQGRTVWDAVSMTRAIAGGSTLDQLSVRAGDEIVVGAKGRSFSSLEGGVRTLLLTITIPAAIAGLVAIF